MRGCSAKDLGQIVSPPERLTSDLRPFLHFCFLLSQFLHLKITPLILTYNEAPNLRRTLEQLFWAQDIVVLDSFSTDETVAIARSFPNVRLVQRPFDNHTDQWNFGVASVRTRFVLALDADYVLTPELGQEMQNLSLEGGVVAWFARFRYCINGRPLRAALYPRRAVLFDREFCHYEQDGHTQSLKINGPAAELSGYIDHDDRKPLTRWLVSQQRYAALEVTKLLHTPTAQLRFVDRLRRQILFAPLLVFFYTLFAKRLILDGWPGWSYVLQRTIAELILSLHLLEQKLKGDSRK